MNFLLLNQNRNEINIVFVKQRNSKRPRMIRSLRERDFHTPYPIQEEQYHPYQTILITFQM